MFKYLNTEDRGVTTEFKVLESRVRDDHLHDFDFPT